MTETESLVLTEAAPVPHQIICLSCGYRRAWPSMGEAIADGRRHKREHTACADPAWVTAVCENTGKPATSV